jgi:hypothetical protein
MTNNDDLEPLALVLAAQLAVDSNNARKVRDMLDAAAETVGAERFGDLMTITVKAMTTLVVKPLMLSADAAGWPTRRDLEIKAATYLARCIRETAAQAARKEPT